MFFTRTLFREGTYTPQGRTELSPAKLLGGINGQLSFFLYFLQEHYVDKELTPLKGVLNRVPGKRALKRVPFEGGLKRIPALSVYRG